jgi:N-acetylmuramoyl-L-alanine amidase
MSYKKINREEVTSTFLSLTLPFFLFFLIIFTIKFNNGGQIEASRQGAVLSKIHIVVLDPGHGGDDKGIVSRRYTENEIALSVSERLGQLLKKRSVTVYLTRTSDKNLTLDERVALSNAQKASAMVSIHVGTLKEIVLYAPVITEVANKKIEPYLVEKGQEPYLTYSNLLSLSLSKVFRENMPNRGVLIRSIPYTMLSRIEAPALILELPSFDSTVYDEEFMDKAARTIMQGLRIYEDKGLKGI